MPDQHKQLKDVGESSGSGGPTLLTVPAEMVGYLREGLHSAMGNAAESITEVAFQAGRGCHPEWYRGPLAHFDRVRRLLDLIGWEEACISGEIRLDLGEHREAIIEALYMEELYGDDHLRESMRADAKRVAEGEPPQDEAVAHGVLALREFVLSVEAQVRVLESKRSPKVVYSTAELGKEIRSRRRELKVSKKLLEEVTGVPRKILGELERDGSSVPLRTALLVVNTLGLDAELRPRQPTKDPR